MVDNDELNAELASACSEHAYDRAVELINAGAQANGFDNLGIPVLLEAAVNSDPRFVVLLLSKGADPNQIDRNGTTPLMEASLAGNFENVKLLLEAGADPTICDPEGYDAIQYAEPHGHKDLIEYLKAQIKNRRG